VAPGIDVSVETWRQRQAKVIAPIQQQRTLVVIMFGIISMVSVVLIFVIFYTIVVQKTRDIGVMKAVGASDGGVALIFLTYGAAIGLVGSILGCIGGYYFVRYINPIQDALDTWFGFRVWSREWFLFEEIPNQVAPTTALAIAIGAIAAGLAGAIIPAVRAARMQPVEALRYE
jgi:lipoprotein-releasing system permease protein